MSGSVIYCIDRQDLISEVSDAWPRFAEENGGVPDPAAVLGRSLWDFIVDEGNRSLYRCIIHEVRHKAESITIPFRCDSPTVERHMTMTVAPGSLGEIVFVTALQYAFDRRPLPVGGPAEEARTIVECESCHRLWAGRGWQNCWEVIRQGDIEIDDRPIKVLRTRCSNC
ncbi:hypothetical protein AAFN88_11390 [Pelagibius sp. CAU 1746]|uniref:hypothetical protein n=1 Tax=Pelagibius sp. CAU 1746 TaxID=3140370 RepID=UPI00325B11AA